MLAAFSSHRQSSSVICTRIQTTLNRLADSRIFVLHPLTTFYACEIALPGLFGNDVSKVKVKNDFCLVHASRNDEVCTENTVVPIDHEVGIDPVVQRPISFANRSGLRFSSLSYKWTPL